MNYERRPLSTETDTSMCAAARLCHVFRCCVTSSPTDLTSFGDTSVAADTHVTSDRQHVATLTDKSWSMRCRRYPDCCHPGCPYIAFDPSSPVPICCCERCDGGWFPPEVSLHMRSCLLACDVNHVTGKSLYDGHCAWTGDVIYLDDDEKAEMSGMSCQFKDVDLLVCMRST